MGNTMDEKEIRQQFKKLVITSLHPECKTYEEALRIEDFAINSMKGEMVDLAPFGNYDPHSYWRITIGRVMAALENKKVSAVSHTDGTIRAYATIGWSLKWKLTKEGIELTDDSQSIDTIKALLNLLK